MSLPKLQARIRDLFKKRPVTSIGSPAVSDELANILFNEIREGVSSSGGGLAPHAASHTSGGSDPLVVAQSQVSGLATSLAGKLDTNHAGTGGTSHAIASTSTAGYLSPGDKQKLDTLDPNVVDMDEQSGGYREVVGGVFPSSVVWWTTSGKTAKLKEKVITRDAEQNPTQIQWKFYASDGATVVRTVTDTITYSGAFETSRTRSVT